MNRPTLTWTQRELYPIERALHAEMRACYRKIGAFYRELNDLIRMQSLAQLQNTELIAARHEYERNYNQIMIQIEEELFKADSIFEIIMDFQQAYLASVADRTDAFFH
jgi:hypothetical protein